MAFLLTNRIAFTTVLALALVIIVLQIHVMLRGIALARPEVMRVELVPLLRRYTRQLQALLIADWSVVAAMTFAAVESGQWTDYLLYFAPVFLLDAGAKVWVSRIRANQDKPKTKRFLDKLVGRPE